LKINCITSNWYHASRLIILTQIFSALWFWFSVYRTKQSELSSERTNIPELQTTDINAVSVVFTLIF